MILVNSFQLNTPLEIWSYENVAFIIKLKYIIFYSILFLGSYGLISLDSSEPYKTIIDSLNPNTLLRDSVGDQCLRFYYYFTVYDKENWGQEIGVQIRPNNPTDSQFSIDTITSNNMQNNGWNFREITFNSNFSDYTVSSVW